MLVLVAALVHVPANLGYPVLFALVAAESAGALVPGETALIVGGTLAADVRLSLPLVVATAAIGASTGCVRSRTSAPGRRRTARMGLSSSASTRRSSRSSTKGPYELPEHLRLDHWALGGSWTVGRENVVLDEPAGSIAFRFHARDAHLVLSSERARPIPFRVRLDGESPGNAHGVDVDESGNGLLGEGRMYQLVRQRDRVRELTLEITFLEPGAEAYVFTFG